MAQLTHISQPQRTEILNLSNDKTRASLSKVVDKLSFATYSSILLLVNRNVGKLPEPKALISTISIHLLFIFTAEREN